MSNEDYYDDDNELDSQEKFSGFSIVDESGIEITEIKKIIKKIEDEAEETIATPVPQNELTVMIDEASELLPQVGQRLDMDLAQGIVCFNGERVGAFKPAFIKRLKQSRAGQYAVCVMNCRDLPVMVKLLFNNDGDGTLIEPFVEQENQ